MAEISMEPHPARTGLAGTGLVCRLRQKSRGGRTSETAGEVELENVSPAVVEIEVQMGPLQYLNLRVTDAGGNVVSGWHYGDCFSPVAHPYTWRLGPGEKYAGPVDLLGNVPDDKRLPGTYRVQAIYEYKALRAVSDPIEVHHAETDDGEAPRVPSNP